MRMKYYLILVLTLTPVLVLAEGRRGGGTGCLGLIMRAGYQTFEWLETNGSKLKLPADKSLSADEFILNLDPTKVLEIEDPKKTVKDDNGKDVTIFFDGQYFHADCSRVRKKETPKSRQRLVAHEVLRRMDLEGDGYEVSRQIFDEPGEAPHIIEDGNICAKTWDGPWDTKKVRFKNLNCHGQRFGAYSGYLEYNTGRLPPDTIGFLGLDMLANAHFICARFGFYKPDVYQTTETLKGSKGTLVLYHDGHTWVPRNNEYRAEYATGPLPYIDFKGGVFTEITCNTAYP